MDFSSPFPGTVPSNVTTSGESTVTSGGTKTLTAESPSFQLFTGTMTHTCAMVSPNEVIGRHYIIKNRSSGNLTVNSGTDSMDNETSIVLGQYGCLHLRSAGTTFWDVINIYTP